MLVKAKVGDAAGGEGTAPAKLGNHQDTVQVDKDRPRAAHPAPLTIW